MKDILTWFLTLRMLRPWLQSTKKEILTWFSAIRRLKTSLQSTMKDILTWFFILRRMKTLLWSFMNEILTCFLTSSCSTLGCRALCERDFDMIFHFKAARNLVAEHHEIDFDLIFHFKVAQNLFAVLQSTMKEDRLIGLALVTMNKNRFNFFLDNFTFFTRKKAVRWKISS